MGPGSEAEPQCQNLAAATRGDAGRDGPNLAATGRGGGLWVSARTEALRVLGTHLVVAEFAEIQRESRHSEGARFDEVIELAEGAASDEQPDMFEFIELVETARDLWGDEGR